MRQRNKETTQPSQQHGTAVVTSALEYVTESTAMPVDTGRVEVQAMPGESSKTDRGSRRITRPKLRLITSVSWSGPKGPG